MSTRKITLLFMFVFLVVGFFITGEVLAAEEAVRPDLTEKVKALIGIAAGFGIGIASFGGALGQSRAIASACEGIARNPGAAGKIFAPTLIVGLALIEFLVILAFMVTNKLAGLI